MKKHIALFALSAAALLGLGACGEAASSCTTPADSGDSESSQTPVVDNSVKLTIDVPDGINVDIEDAPADGKYYPGDEVVFTVERTSSYPMNKQISKILVNGHEAVTKDDVGDFFFIMPKGGATIKIEDKEICDAKVFEVSDIDSEAIPTLAKDDYNNVEKVTAFTKSISDILIESDKVQGDYLMDASFSLKNSPIPKSGYSNTKELNIWGISESVYQGKGHVYAVENNRMKMEFSGVNGTGNNTYKYAVEEGYYGDSLFYKRNTKWTPYSGTSYDYRANGTDQIYLYNVVTDDIESTNYNSKTMIKLTDANNAATEFGIGKAFATGIYSGTSSVGLIYTSGDALVNQIKEVNTTIATDNKSYTMEIVSYDLSNLSGKQFHQYINTFTIDGDGFVSKLSCVDNKYTDDAYWDTTSDKLTDDAVAASTSYSTFNMTRGFKHSETNLDMTDVSKYKMKDYEIEFDVQNSWAGRRYVSTADLAEGEALELEVGTKITGMTFADYSSDFAVVTPTFLGADDEELLTVSGSTYTVAGKGETKLVFDNWFGDIKEIDVKFVDPKPYSIVASFDKSVVDPGETITLTASVSPAAADQGYNVTLAEDDPTESILTKNDDGTWSIATVKSGTSSVTITSTADPSVTKTMSFSVTGPATLAGIKALLPTVTFATTSADKSNFASDIININFNADGTGYMVAWCYGRTYGESDFTWTIDETSLVVTITGKAIDSVTISSFTPINSASFKIAYTISSTTGEVFVYACNRVADLSKGPWVTGIA